MKTGTQTPLETFLVRAMADLCRQLPLSPIRIPKSAIQQNQKVWLDIKETKTEYLISLSPREGEELAMAPVEKLPERVEVPDA